MQQLTVPNLCDGEGKALMAFPFPPGTMTVNVVKVTLEPGCSCGEHLRTDDNELLYVLEGEPVMLEDGKEYILHVGECEYGTAGHTQGAVNRSSQTASILVVTMPRGEAIPQQKDQ